MPHSTSDLPSQIAYAQSIKNMTSASRLNGSASTTSLDNKWKRASLPVSDIYGDLRSPIESHRGRSGSIISTASTAVIHRKSQYYDSNHGMSRDKVLRESPMIAELRTNVIIKDEYTLVTDLSYHLATRYSKPDAAIMINIDHSSCLALAGTFDPCYILTITTTPTHLSAPHNKRNAALIQAFMADILSVPPDRGIIRFVAIPEENYAMNGNTVHGELERVEKQVGMDGVKRTLTDTRKGTASFKKSTTDLDRTKQNGIVETDEQEKKAERGKSGVSGPPEVFELPADTEDTQSVYAAENGLRMNGVSKEDLTNSRTPNGRPKTFAGQSASPTSIESVPKKHISSVARPDAQKAAHMPKPRIDTKPVRQHSTGAKSTTTPITPVTLKETIVDNPKILKSIDTDTTANTAKRRSTISATPKMPVAPPIPESKTPKVSKRKSFLAAFRR